MTARLESTPSDFKLMQYLYFGGLDLFEDIDMGTAH